MKSLFLSLWLYRGFILGTVKREFQLKYRYSILGSFWTVVNPLAMIFVYTVIFSEIMQARLPGIESRFSYSIYLCAGILTWGLFVEIVSRSQNIFIDNANLLKKLNFPRLTLPVVIVLSALLNFAVIFSLFTVFLLISGNFPGWIYLALFPVLLIQIAFSIGLGIIVGVLNVFFRDVGQFFSIILQFWFWLTPIVYSVNVLPANLQGYLSYNPLVPLIACYQSILTRGVLPEWNSLLPISLISIGLCVFGLRLFRKRVGEMVDEL
jgi:lipopolysaccharide transport system permease protein